MTHFPVLNDKAHESLCTRCGVSCHMALEVGDAKYVIEEIHCRFLTREPDGHFDCTVYEKRFEVAPWCHTAEEAVATGNLSPTCLYAAHIKGYKGKTWATPEIRKKLMPIVKKKLIADGLPLSENPDSALKALTANGDTWTYTEQSDRFVFRRKRRGRLIG
jgi:uncharacterized cysteine cluster protein YcgN (CxxCxxCC family)